MLYIYVGKENLPKDKNFIFDVEGAFPQVLVNGNDFQCKVLTALELGEYCNNKRFTDRFGAQLYYTDMSTGAKALFEVQYFKDEIINVTECGDNAISLLSYLDEGHAYFEDRTTPLTWEVKKPVCYNGKIYEDMGMLNYYEF